LLTAHIVLGVPCSPARESDRHRRWIEPPTVLGKKTTMETANSHSKGLVANASAKITEVARTVGNVATDAQDKVGQAAKQGGHRLQETAEKAGHAAKEIAAKLIHSAQETAQKVGHGAQEAANTAEHRLQELANKTGNKGRRQ
jgi:hypothetical protein